MFGSWLNYAFLVTLQNKLYFQLMFPWYGIRKADDSYLFRDANFWKNIECILKLQFRNLDALKDTLLEKRCPQGIFLNKANL